MDYNRNNNPYPQPDNPYNPGRQPQLIRNPGQTMAMVSLFLGITSVFTVFTLYLPTILGSIAIVLAILSKGYGKRMLSIATAGIGAAIGGITLIVVIYSYVISLFLSMSGDELIKFGRQMDEQIEQQFGQDVETLTGTSYEEIMEIYVEMTEK